MLQAALERGLFCSGHKAHKVFCRVLPSFIGLKILQECTDFNSIQVRIEKRSGNAVLPLVFTSLLCMIEVFFME